MQATVLGNIEILNQKVIGVGHRDALLFLDIYASGKHNAKANALVLQEVLSKDCTPLMSLNKQFWGLHKFAPFFCTFVAT